MSDDQALFSQFLSTGRNCEFGIVQKWSEATRLGLLDWLAATPYALLNMLKNRFEGIGEPHQTLLYVLDTEYIIEDARYRIRGHSWEQTTEITREKSYEQACGRLKLLKRKMLEELRLGERIFVYKLNLLPVNFPLMRNIAEQIAGYGPGCLLGVFDARVNGKPDFQVEWAGPNLLLAYHPRLAPYEAAHRIDMAGWRQICRTALDMVAAGRPVLPDDKPPPQRANLALHKPALQSSVWHGQGKTRKEDAAGGNNGDITGGYGFHTDHETDPWWQVDLLQPTNIAEVHVFNRTEMRERCTRITLSTSPDGTEWDLRAAKLDATLFGGADGAPHVFRFAPPITARFVRITMIGEGFLHLEEVEVYGAD